MSEITPNELKIMFQDFNQRTDEKFNDMAKKSDERHADYKEERKETKIMLEEINASLKSMKERHTNTEQSIALLLKWSEDAKKVIETNSTNIGQLQKKDYMVMGGVAVILGCGLWVLNLWVKDLKETVSNEVLSKIKNEWNVSIK